MSVSEDLARAVKAKDEADARAKVQRVKDALGLDTLAAKAEGRLRHLEGRASRTAALLKEMDVDAGARDAILKKHPALDGYYKTVDNKRDALRDLVFGRQSRLVRALAAYAALTEKDLEPRKEFLEEWKHTGRGMFSPHVWKIYTELGNNALPPIADIDQAVEYLRAARHELDERLGAIANAPTR